MLPYLTGQYGNPSSLYSFGRKAKKAVDRAREQVASAINAEPEQIFFTSGATESNAWVISNFNKALCSRVEHHSIMNNPKCIQMNDEPLAEQIQKERPNLVTHMLVNNETGEIFFNIKKMCKITHTLKVPFHTDATAAFGHVPIDVQDLDVDYLSLSGHKFHAPKGVGVLYAKDPTTLKLMLYGGGQEKNLRAGTENVASIVAIGKAAELYNYDLEVDAKASKLRNHLKGAITNSIPNVRINEPKKSRVNNILNVSFKGIEGESLMLLLDREGICVSSGSACNSGSLEPSHVLKAMGVPDDYIFGTIRLSFSEFNTNEEIIQTANELKRIVELLRGNK